MQGHDTSAIRADGLVKRYPGDVTALDGLSFSVEAGTVFGLLGPNGAGKSTTVKVLTTLSRPDDGRAVVAGIDVLRDPERVRHVIGAVGQRVAVDPDATGRENLELAGRIHGLGGTRAAQRVDELLAHFGLTEAADRMARTYSGGMQRKLDVATGLIHRPLILFLDEPTTGLDPEARAELWAEIGRLDPRGRPDDPAHHPLPRRGRSPGQPARHCRPRAHRGRGHARRAQGRAARRRNPCRARRGAADDRAADALATSPGIGESLVDGRSLRARAERGASAVPIVLSALEGAGIGVASVTVSRPSLDDVYLRHTGRAYRQTEESFA